MQPSFAKLSLSQLKLLSAKGKEVVSSGSRDTSKTNLCMCGFTLIEVLLAVVLLSMVMTVGYGSLSHIIKGKNLLDDERDTMLIGGAVLTRLTRELQLAYADNKAALLTPPDQASSSNSSSRILEGKSEKLSNGDRGDSITFLAMEGGQYLPDGGQHTGVVQITYRVEKDPEQSNDEEKTYLLIRDEVPYIHPAEKAYKKRMTFPITSRLTELQFDFYDAEQGQWVSTWGTEGGKKLPAMIRFNIGIRSMAGKVSYWSTAVFIRSDS